MEFEQNAYFSDSTAEDSLSEIAATILTIRNERVILDSDIARMFGVQTKRLNEQVKRNRGRFGEKYAFKLTSEEYAVLKSQIATSKVSSSDMPLGSQSATAKPGRGGRRTSPWVFTERGVVMAATILDSDRAVEASKMIVEVFVEVRHRLSEPESLGIESSADDNLSSGALQRLTFLGSGIGAKLQLALQQVLDSVVDTHRKTTVREEAQTLISESIQHLKERLKQTGLENEEILARVTKLLAEAEKSRAQAAKTRAETEALEFATIIRKLRLLMEVQKAMVDDNLDDFVGVLKELGDDIR